MYGYFQGLVRVRSSNVASSQTKQPTVHLGNFQTYFLSEPGGMRFKKVNTDTS